MEEDNYSNNIESSKYIELNINNDRFELLSKRDALDVSSDISFIKSIKNNYANKPSIGNTLDTRQTKIFKKYIDVELTSEIADIRAENIKNNKSNKNIWLKSENLNNSSEIEESQIEF
jgi:hypothetical protein